MIGDMATEKWEAEDTSPEEERPGVKALQNMLKKASQSPYQMEDVTDNQQIYGQTGVHRALSTANPFYSYYLETKGQSDTSTKSPDNGNTDSICVSPPEFQSSPWNQPDANSDFKTQNDFFHKIPPKPKPKPAVFPKTYKLSSDFHDVTLSSSAISLNLNNGSRSESQNNAAILFEQAKTEDLVFATHSNQDNQSPGVSDILSSSNPFYSSSNGNDVFDSASGTTADISNNKENHMPALAKNRDIFSTAPNDMFFPLSSDAVDPFSSPVPRIIDFSSMEDPFADSPLKLSDPFQDASYDTSDIFQPFSPEVNDVVKMAPSRPKPPRPTPPSRTPKVTTPTEKPQEIVLTTPQGSQHNIQQPTPTTQVDGLDVSPSQSPKLTHVPTFRRPPKPLPRIRRRRMSSSASKPTPEKTLKPERPPLPTLPQQTNESEPVEPMQSPEASPPKTSPKPSMPKLSANPSFKPLLPKPVIHRKPKSKDKKSVTPENYVVFEDILLIGQEQCVEDWPEDSPQNNPDFKPSGTLRLRRESILTKTDSEGEDHSGLGSSTKKKDKRFRMSMLPRRDSKDPPSDECLSRSRTFSGSRKSSKDYLAETQGSAEENEDPDQWADYRKPHLKDKVNNLLRRKSAAATISEQKHMNGHVPHESKDHEGKKGWMDSLRRRSEGTVLDAGSGGESGDDAQSKKKWMPKLKFMAQKDKESEEDLKGVHGHAPYKSSKENLSYLGAHANYTPHKKSQDNALQEMKSHSLQSFNKAEKSHHSPAGLNGEEEAYNYEPEELKLKTSKPNPIPRKARKNHGMPEELGFQPGSPQLDSNDELDGDDCCGQNSKQALSPAEMYNYEEDEADVCEPKKKNKNKLKAFKNKLKKKSNDVDGDLPGAVSGEYMSEAARAELMASEKDRNAMDDFDEGDDDWDTDSLMEWWCTVEQWDEVPSDEEEHAVHEDESKSFSILADKVQRGLRLFNKVFTERAEVLWQSVVTLHAIADDISTFHNKARITGIAGGTTTAAGGVVAITGLVLAPFTLGATLVVAAVGAGVAAAGGITSASAAISDNVHCMNDRKKVEAVLLDNETHLLELSKILNFTNTGLYKLRGHAFLRSGTQHYSQDWEVRRAVQIISMVDSPVMKATACVDGAVSSVQGLFEGMDKYFLKDSREFKKEHKKAIVGVIKDVAHVLNDCIVELNGVREELQEAMGEV